MTGTVPVQGVRWGTADYRSAERRTLMWVTLLGIPCFLAALLLVPNLGPVYRTYSIPASSMEPAAPIGSYALVSRAAYGYSRSSFDWFSLPIAGRFPDRAAARGDVVVFRLPRDRSVHYIKRIVGLPGEKIQMQKGRLWIDGQIVSREPLGSVPSTTTDARTRLVPAYLEKPPSGPAYQIIEEAGDAGFLDNTGVFEVPAGHYFMLGDNRDNSSDSRTPSAVGFVPRELLIGRIVYVFGTSRHLAASNGR